MTEPARWDGLSDRIRSGEPLSADDVEALADSPDVLRLGALADDRRRARRGDRVTYVRVLEVAATEVGAGRGNGTIPASAGEVRLAGCPATEAEVLAAVARATDVSGNVPVTGFALDELVACCGGDATHFDRFAAALRRAGLTAVAEAVVERTDRPDWIGRARDAGLPVARLTVHDPAAAGMDTIRRVAGWGGGAPAQAFAPLPRRLADKPTTGYDDVRQVAFSRLLVDNIDSIQVDWRLYGPQLAQVALAFGADDIDGVSPVDTLAEGPRRVADVEIRRQIRAAGLEPVERDGRFGLRLADKK